MSYSVERTVSRGDRADEGVRHHRLGGESVGGDGGESVSGVDQCFKSTDNGDVDAKIRVCGEGRADVETAFRTYERCENSCSV